MSIYPSRLIGVGKSTVGRQLAAELGWAFDDLDTAMADLVVLDWDPSEVPAEGLSQIKVDRTMIRGKVAYERAAG